MSPRPISLAIDGATVIDRLDGVTAKLNPGAVNAICGPNGAGKSTLLSCLAGLLAPDRGVVRIGGTPMVTLTATQRAQAIGYLPQNAEVAWDLSVETLVALGRLPWHGAPAGETQAAIDDAIATMDLQHVRDRPVSQLSGGERARALMARVLATRPDWLLADEPLASLDLGHTIALTRHICGHAAAGSGVIIVVHDLTATMNHADRVLVLDRGRLVADGPPESALSETVLREVWGVDARWIGEPGARALAMR